MFPLQPTNLSISYIPDGVENWAGISRPQVSQLGKIGSLNLFFNFYVQISV